jgi:hypothetical protein
VTTIVLVVGDCNSEDGTFEGFKARFEGEKVSTFAAGDRWRFTLYKCGWNQYRGYRVYEADERQPKSPRYELTPHEGQAVNFRDTHGVRIVAKLQTQVNSGFVPYSLRAASTGWYWLGPYRSSRLAARSHRRQKLYAIGCISIRHHKK